jgi:hypothetical protein
MGTPLLQQISLMNNGVLDKIEETPDISSLDIHFTLFPVYRLRRMARRRMMNPPIFCNLFEHLTISLLPHPTNRRNGGLNFHVKMSVSKKSDFTMVQWYT